VGALRMPPWPPAAAAASPAAAALLARRFAKALRLLRALGCFEGVLARAPLAGLALERLLHQQARRPAAPASAGGCIHTRASMSVEPGVRAGSMPPRPRVRDVGVLLRWALPRVCLLIMRVRHCRRGGATIWRGHLPPHLEPCVSLGPVTAHARCCCASHGSRSIRSGVGRPGARVSAAGRAQMLPYLRAAAADLPLAVDRMERLAGALRPEWFAGGPPAAAAPLLEFAGVLARSLEQQRGGAALGNGAARGAGAGSGAGSGAGAASGSRVANIMLAGRLAAVLARLGDAGRAAQLRAAYKL